jgi:FkbM family methyltransferase
MSLHTLIEKVCKYFGIAVIFKRIHGSYSTAHNTAVKSKFGFWYIGDIFSRQDTVYGILQNGGIEIAESEIFIKLLQHISTTSSNPVIYDIGANTGYYSLLTTSTLKSATVHAFEPIPNYVAQINANLALNQVDSRVTVHTIGLSDTNGTAELHLAGTGSTLEKEFQPTSRESLTIATYTLDSYVSEYNIPAPHIMKIDVENHELSALKGATETIKNNLPFLFIEIIDSYHTFKNQKFTDTLKYIDQLGYNIFHIDSSGTLSQITNIDSYYSTKIEMYTCIPKSLAYVIGS